MSPDLLLDRLVDFERRVRRVYLTLGTRPDFPAAVRFFWNCIAEEEGHHLAILERSAALLDVTEVTEFLPVTFGKRIAEEARQQIQSFCEGGIPCRYKSFVSTRL